MVETSTYAKRIDFEPYDKTIDEMMDGLKSIFKKHPATLTDLRVNVDQAGDGATARLQLILMTNYDASDGDNSFLDENERKTPLLVHEMGGESTETDWVEPPFEYCIRCGTVTKFDSKEHLSRLKIIHSGRLLKCGKCGDEAIDLIE